MLARAGWFVCILALVAAAAVTWGVAAKRTEGQSSRTRVEVTQLEDTLAARYVFAAPSIQPGETVGTRRVTIEGTQTLRVSGEPLVPLRRVMLVVPAGTEAVGMRLELGRRVELGHFRLEVAGPPEPLGSGIGTVGGASLPTDGSPIPYPASPSSDMQLQSKGGIPVAIVGLFPVSYYPESTEVFCYESITVVLVLRPRILDDVGIMTPTDADKTLLRAMVDNPEALNGY